MEGEEINKEEKKEVQKTFKKEHLKCGRCGSTNCYTNKDGTRVCRKCSFREKKEI